MIPTVTGAGKVAGHSGTARKHRKAFSDIKDYQRKRVPTEKWQSKSPSHNTKKFPLAFEERQKTKWMKLVIGLPAFFGFIAIVFLGFSQRVDFSYIDNRDRKNEYEMMPEDEILWAKYSYCSLGYKYLAEGELYKAHSEFLRILKINDRHTLAVKGLTQVLIKLCDENPKYCTDADNYMKYVSKHKLANDEEIYIWYE